MRRILALTFVVTLLLTTYFIPITTLVKADVVIGDNNDIYVNENAKILGRKMALMECVPDILNSGATQITITDTNDLDDYLDYLWNELNGAIDYLESPQAWQDLNANIRGDYLNNINNYINHIDNRANYFSELLRDPTTSLLKSYILGGILGKNQYQPYDGTLKTFGILSRLNNGGENPNPLPNYEWFTDEVNHLWNNNEDFITTNPTWSFMGTPWGTVHINGGSSSYSYIALYSETGFGQLRTHNVTNLYNNPIMPVSPITINLVSNNQGYNAYYSTYNHYSVYNFYVMDTPYPNEINYGNGRYFSFGWSNGRYYTASSPDIEYPTYTQSSFHTLDEALNYILLHYANINVYVDDVPWVLMPTPISINPTLDIDGFLTIYGDDKPPKYEIPQGTTIDYDLLYNTIYNAITNSLPISQQNINYYDSHDQTYSPTIINNYGSDGEGDEDDFIDSLLTWAVIPEFDTALLVPLEQPLLAGEKIFITSVQVFPNEILLVIGAAFVLVLFAAFINRLIE